MKKAQLLSACSFLLWGALVVAAQQVERPRPDKQNDTAATELEVKKWFDSYAEDLRAARRAAIVDRYDRRGYFRLGNGSKTLLSPEEVKDRYLNKWSPPKSFLWRDVSVEVLSPNTVLVIGLFDLEAASGEVQTYSYSGLLIKGPAGWKIRVEDESVAPRSYTIQPVSGDPSAAGAFRYLLKAQPGASIAAHRHSAAMRITVRSGRKYILMGDIANSRVQTFEAGSTLVIPANTWHVEWWEAETVEEIDGVGPMKTERATPSTPRAQ